MKRLVLFSCVLILSIGASSLLAEDRVTPSPDALHDGSHDFDFEIGAWNTHLRRLQHPLTGSTTWVEYDGTSDVRGVLENRANIVELTVAGPAGRIEGAALRLYEPASHRWTINFFSVVDGQLTPPVVGEFKNGRGVFYGDDTLGAKAIKVRFEIIPVTKDSYRFEQFFSQDGGKTWELNWVATDMRR